MEALFIGALGLTAITAILLQRKKQTDLVVSLQLLFGVIVLLWLGTFYGEAGRKATLALAAVLGIAFAVSRIVQLPKLLKIAIAPVLMFTFYFLFGRETFSFMEEATVLEDKFVITGMVLAALGMNLAELVLFGLKRWIPDQDQWKSALALLFAGLGVFLGAVSAPVMGSLIIAATFAVVSVFQGGRNGQIGVAVFALASLPALAAGAFEPMLLNADVIGGLFVGAFGMFLVHNIWKSARPNFLAIALGYGLAFGFAVVLAMGSQASELFGGHDAFAAAILGAALVNAKTGNSFEGVSLLAGLLAIGMLLPEPIAGESLEGESLSFSQGASSSDPDAPKEQLKLLPLSDVAGTYSIDPEASQIIFQLGKGGATKGKFKKVSGSFTIAEDVTATKAKVVLDMSDFTTLNKMRDEELRGDAYFKVNKYPTMKYEITGLEKKGDMEYLAKGRFTMLGVTKSQEVTLMRIDLGDAIVLQGSGKIDRTEFGMTPSAAEGNVVSFEYRATLKP